MQNLNILIIDDEPDISELIGLLLSTEFNLECTHANSGSLGIKYISERDEKFDLIICDFNMPNGNGKAVFDHIVTYQLGIPFLLVTNDSWEMHRELHNRKNVGYLQKPFSEEDLLAAVNKCILGNVPELSQDIYVQVTLNTLLKIHRIACPLFLKINETKFVKIFNEGSLFDETAYQKYKQKNISSLYVLKEQFNSLVIEFKNKVLIDFMFKSYKAEASETFQVSASAQEIVNSSIHSLGFSEQNVAITQENIKLVKAMVDRTPALQTMIRWLDKADYKYEFIHSMLLCYFINTIAQKFNFKSVHAIEFLSLAAFFHDISLEAYHIENEPKFKEAIKQGILINRTDIDYIKKHPTKSVEILSSWQMCPREVLVIIENHCERPDGRGFPKGLKFSELDELSACFIFSEDLVSYFLSSKNKANLEDYLLKNAQYYSEAPFKEFYQIILNLLNETREEQAS